MYRYSIAFIFLLLFARDASAVDSWKIIPRQTYYTAERSAQILLHVPEDQIGNKAFVTLTHKYKSYFADEVQFINKVEPLEISLDGLGPGDYNFTGKIEGEGISEELNAELFILEGKMNCVKVDRLKGGLVINDLPWFPFGYYCYSPVQPTLAEEEVVKGFNMMSPYQKIEGKTREERLAYLDRAAQLGMKVHYNLLSVAGGGGVGSGRDLTSSEQEKRQLLREEIEAFMDHPALLAWYISDEPTGHGETPEELKSIYDFVKSIDPWHPITIVFMAPMQARRYADAMDIVMADPYPIPNSGPESVGYVTRNLVNEFYGEMPVWIVPQAFGGAEHWGREPSVQELRVMTYLPLVNGATGIQYFVRHGLNGFPKSTSAWGMAGQIALETQEITPFLLHGDQVNIAKCDQDNIHLGSWVMGGQTLVMAVNESIEPGPLRIQLEELPDTIVRVLFEDRTVSVEEGILEDYIDGYGRRVYLLGRQQPSKIEINSLNMILDPGFEDPASPGIPASCYARVGKDRGATWFTDSRISVEGGHSLRINTPVPDNGSALTFFPVMVNSGTGYTLSVWAKYDPASYREEKATFWQRLFGNRPDPNRYFTLSFGGIKTQKFRLSDDWEKYSMTVSIPENSEASSRINPALTMVSQGTAWFDALEMYPDPVIDYGVDIESGSFQVKVSSSQPDGMIKWEAEGKMPDARSPVYEYPVTLRHSTVFTAGVFIDDTLYNYSRKSFFVHLATGKKLSYNRKYSSRYNGGGDYGLVDGIRGSNNYTDGLWQGFLANNMVATIDLGEPTQVKEIIVGCLQDTRSWIFMPSSISVYGSEDGEFFSFLGKADNNVSMRATGSVKKDFNISFDPQIFRYIRVNADNIGVCPDWHNGKGQGAFLFVDEIIVN